MATTTTNFGWDIPQSTDLVKDGATAIAALGQDIDTALIDLKGGTTGQILAKASNTDLDYSWVTTDDANAIQNAIVDAKGDLIAASAADVPARLAVGANGETLIADSTTATGLRWQGNYEAGKNKIINGDFGVWQRGTSFTNILAGSYCADRFREERDGTTSVANVTRETFTPGTAPVAGYEGTFFLRDSLTTVGNGTFIQVSHSVEDVRTFAGQTVTLSFWAKADSARTSVIFLAQQFGTGGSAAVFAPSQSITYGTSWQRFSFTFSLASITGKTIGTSSRLLIGIRSTATTGSILDIWGVQLEAGSVATPFQTATGTAQGELAACQRYYYRISATTITTHYGIGFGVSSSAATIQIKTPVSMRVSPTVIDYSNVMVFNTTGNFAVSTLSFSDSNPDVIGLNANATGLVANVPLILRANATTSSYVGFSAEL